MKQQPSDARVDAYIEALDEPKRSTLQKLRTTIRELLPDAEETISYSMPAYRLNGKVIAGFAAFSKHLAYLPHSGSVFEALKDELAGYERTSGSLHFPVGAALPKGLVKKLIEVRLKQVSQAT